MEKKTKAWGIASLCLGIASILLVFAPYFGLPLAITAIVFYSIQKKHEPTGPATGGLVTGIIGIVINFIALVFIGGVLLILATLSDVTNDVSVIDSTDTVSIQSSTEDDTTQETTTTKKIKSATISVDRVTETAANLGPIRITVTNTGDVFFTPHFDVTIKSDSGNTVCEDSPLLGIGSISAGQKKTDEIQILACIFNKDGDYTVKVDLLDEDYKKLDSDSKTLTVFYFGQFDEMLEGLG